MLVFNMNNYFGLTTPKNSILYIDSFNFIKSVRYIVGIMQKNME